MMKNILKFFTIFLAIVFLAISLAFLDRLKEVTLFDNRLIIWLDFWEIDRNSPTGEWWESEKENQLGEWYLYPVRDGYHSFKIAIYISFYLALLISNYIVYFYHDKIESKYKIFIFWSVSLIIFGVTMALFDNLLFDVMNKI